jgi:hypothetical protein
MSRAEEIKAALKKLEEDQTAWNADLEEVKQKLSALTPDMPEYLETKNKLEIKEKELKDKQEKLEEDRKGLKNELDGLKAAEPPGVQGSVAQKQDEKAEQASNRRSYILLASGLIVFIILGLGMYWANFLQSLKDMEVARGLITFLVTITTIAIAIILVIFAVSSTSNDEKIEAAFKDHFTNAKEVLTALIGVLGAIIGFYFGSMDTTKKQVKEPVLQVAPALIPKTTLHPGEILSLTSHVSGGKPPYKYSISFDPEIKIDPEIKEKAATDDDYIVEEIKIPATTPEKKYNIKLNIKDNSDKTVNLDKFQKIEVKK